MEQEKTQEIKMNPEQQIAELQAQIAAAQAQIAQIKSSVAETKATVGFAEGFKDVKSKVKEYVGSIGYPKYVDGVNERMEKTPYENVKKKSEVPEGMHEMPDGSIMADADMESANLQERNTADALAAYEADKRNLTGNRNADGDFVQAPDEGLGPIKITGANSDIDVDKKTDAESKKMRRTSNKDVTFFEASPDMERDGGRAAAEEVEPSERTMGFKADEGGTMSVDEKDDFWKTEEGYNKAIEMYGEQPSWVKEPTMMFNPETQEYEKIKEEDKEQFEDLSIADNIKQLFG